MRIPGADLKKLLVVRNGKIGDLAVSLPALALLRRSLPRAEITLLGSEYTRGLAQSVPYADRVWTDPAIFFGMDHPQASTWRLARRLYAERFDASISFRANKRCSHALFLARVPFRFAPFRNGFRHQWRKLLFHDGVQQNRDQGARPEFEYDVRLTEAFLQRLGAPTADGIRPPYLALPAGEATRSRDRLCSEVGLESSRPIIMIHSGLAGAPLNLSDARYVTLLQTLEGIGQLTLLSGLGQEARDRHIAERSGVRPRVIPPSTLERLIGTIHAADLMIASSTGPLHIAGALNVPTVGFYARAARHSALRWHPPCDSGRHLAFSVSADAGVDHVDTIDLQAASREIRSFVAQFVCRSVA